MSEPITTKHFIVLQKAKARKDLVAHYSGVDLNQAIEVFKRCKETHPTGQYRLIERETVTKDLQLFAHNWEAAS